MMRVYQRQYFNDTSVSRLSAAEGLGQTDTITESDIKSELQGRGYTRQLIVTPVTPVITSPPVVTRITRVEAISYAVTEGLSIYGYSARCTQPGGCAIEPAKFDYIVNYAVIAANRYYNQGYLPGQAIPGSPTGITYSPASPSYTPTVLPTVIPGMGAGYKSAWMEASLNAVLNSYGYSKNPSTTISLSSAQFENIISEARIQSDKMGAGCTYNEMRSLLESWNYRSVFTGVTYSPSTSYYSPVASPSYYSPIPTATPGYTEPLTKIMTLPVTFTSRSGATALATDYFKGLDNLGQAATPPGTSSMSKDEKIAFGLNILASIAQTTASYFDAKAQRERMTAMGAQIPSLTAAEVAEVLKQYQILNPSANTNQASQVAAGIFEQDKPSTPEWLWPVVAGLGAAVVILMTKRSK